MPGALHGRVVLIAGASHGLGAVVTREFAKTGAALTLVARNAGPLQMLAAELGLPADRVLIWTADATQERTVADLVAAVVERWGRVDVLLNCVGEWMGGKRVWETEAATWDTLMTLNLRAAFLLSQAVLPSMLQSGWGRIIHISSRMALEPHSLSVAYTVSKMGLIRLTEVLASELKGTGVTANVILPSIIDTPDTRASAPRMDFAQCVPGEAIAAMMQFLCTDAASYVNGAQIPMYGMA